VESATGAAGDFDGFFDRGEESELVADVGDVEGVVLLEDGTGVDEIIGGNVELAEVVETGGESGSAGFKSSADFGLDQFSLEVVEGFWTEACDEGADIAVGDLQEIILDRATV